MNYVILTQQGSGSNLLRSFLNSHPNICIVDEILDHCPEIDRVPKMEEFFNIYSQKYKCPGCDIKYNQFSDSDNVLRFIAENKFGVIQIFRDPCRTAMREFIRSTHGTITKKDFDEHCVRIRRNQEKIRGLFGNGKYKEIYYENMTRGREITFLPEDFERDLLEWFDVPYMKLHIDRTHVVAPLTKTV